jgi:hypothetical protein
LHPGVAETLTATDASTEARSHKIAELRRRGYPEAQAVRIAYEEERHGGIHDRQVKDFAGYYAPESIGKTRRITPESFLILESTPIARVGEQLYGAHEIEGLQPNGSGFIVVQRLPEEVFRSETIASFEGKDFVIEHPPEGVDVENWKNHTVGHVQNVRRGEGIEDDLLIADIIVKDPKAIEHVNKNLPDISAGYNADYEQTEPGRAIQRNIIGNHVAGVRTGRAGSRVAVRDHQPRGVMSMALKIKWDALRAKLVALGIKSTDADKLQTEAGDFTVDAADGGNEKLMERIEGLDAGLKKVADWQRARDEAEEKERKEKAETDKRARDAAEEEERKRKEKGEGEKAEETGDTILEAESPGHVLNLGKTWKGNMTGDSANEPVLSAVVARAEILVPGIPKPTADSIKGNKGTVLSQFMRTAIERHMTKDTAGAENVAPFLLGRKVADLKGLDLVGVFNGVAHLARVRNNLRVSTLHQRRTTGDAPRGPVSNSELNEINRKFWAERK